MRTMPANMTAAVSSSLQQLAISVVVQDNTLSFSQLTTGPNAGHVTSISSSVGTILRAVITSAGSIYVTRITIANSAAQWGAAGVLAASGARFTASCNMSFTTGLVRLFYIRNSDAAICYVDSTNDGVSWSAENVAAAAPVGLGYCHGIATTDVSNCYASYAQYDGSTSGQGPIYHTTLSGTWSTLAPSGPAGNWGQIRGMDAVLTAKAQVVAGYMRILQTTGFAAGAYSINGGISPWATIKPMDPPGIGVSHQYPSVFSSGTYYSTTTAFDDGSVSGTATTKTEVWQSSDGVTWAPVANLGNLFPNGASVLTSNGVFYVFDGQTVMQSSTGTNTLDITPDLITLEIIEKPNSEGAASITLTNYNGQYTNAPQLKSNASVTIKFGYGPDLITTHVMYIDQVRNEATADKLEIILDLRDCMKFLTQVSSRFIALSGKTIAQLIQYVCDQAGVTVASIATTPQFSQVIPCFAITPGETWDTALNRLANVYAFAYRREGSTVIFSERQSNDASVWSYGSETFGINWSKSADQSSVIRVIGAPTGNTVAFAEAVDTAQLTATGRERYRHIVERLLTSSAQCQIKAGLAMREEQTHSTTGSVTVALNPGLQLLDVLTITDARVGLTNQRARVEEIHWHVDMNTGAYHQQLALTLP